MSCLLILKNGHSTLEQYSELHKDWHPEINFCAWRNPWQRFVSAVWTDVVMHQNHQRTSDYSIDMVVPLINDKVWLRRQIEGGGQDTLFYQAGHMITQWNNLQQECQRLDITQGAIRIYKSIKTATEIHYNISTPQIINQSPPDVILRIDQALRPFKAQIIEEWLQQDYTIWDQLDPQLHIDSSTSIDIPVDKIRKDI